MDIAAQVEPGVISEFVKPGIARLVYRHFPIVAPLSADAAAASECAADLGLPVAAWGIAARTCRHDKIGPKPDSRSDRPPLRYRQAFGR